MTTLPETESLLSHNIAAEILLTRRLGFMDFQAVRAAVDPGTYIREQVAPVKESEVVE